MKDPKKGKTVPLTKKMLERVIAKAGRQASKSAMETAGYVIKVQNGWVVKEDRNGVITRISEVKKSTVAFKLD